MTCLFAKIFIKQNLNISLNNSYLIVINIEIWRIKAYILITYIIKANI